MNVPYGPILIVEDVEHILKFLEVTLRFKGYPVAMARNGQEALEYIAREHPSLVVTDILMPKLDGYALAYHLRSNPRTQDIPIIFLSATYVTPEDKEFALSLGAVRFLEKPVDTEEFLLTVAEVLTQGPGDLPQPLDRRTFYEGYRQRLETKLQHKLTQITRTERLLETLPEDQRAPFQSMLTEACMHRDEIMAELQTVNQRLAELEAENAALESDSGHDPDQEPDSDD